MVVLPPSSQSLGTNTSLGNRTGDPKATRPLRPSRITPDGGGLATPIWLKNVAYTWRAWLISWALLI